MGDEQISEANGGARTMASTLAESILRDIVKGVLRPGSKLKVRELSDRYRAGPIPVREALSRLAMSGFVDAEDQRGFRVTAISKEDLADITRVRQRLETDALRDAMTFGGVAWEGAVLAAYHQLTCVPITLPSDPSAMNPAWERAHDQFHETLLSGSRSRWLKQFASTLRIQTARYRHQSIRSEHATERDVVKEHDNIIQAVLARDADLACDLLAKHFDATANLLMSD
ncbi:HTH-type transcriptional repressor RspR [Pandoraea eparura]|uniref:HTH-type transcriptional repressor RspR n=1 Tax=Pandoraea eparura TaxID=2508291 RepID=A0A5E4REE2_9BURK|nr:GntR family transcriptional regulator [Pandoraea eparura]VVD61670.1 HTH-type transcriptional repressor RspR [Pandoraea eparura]